jgi:hypothetical protein
MDEVAQWAYTVITRARTQLCFLTEHTFAPPARVPVAAERMKMPPTFAAPVDEPGEPQAPVLTDDIPDNPVSPAVESYIASMPPGRHLPTEALLNQFCATLEGKIGQWVAEQSMSTVKILDAVLGKMVECLEKASGVNEHAQYQLSNTLEKLLGQGVQVRSAPYTVEIRTQTPQGFQVMFHLTKESAAELAQATEALLAWLHSSGYGAPSVHAAPLTEADGIPF